MPRLKTVQPRLKPGRSRIGRSGATAAEMSRARDADHKWRRWYRTKRWKDLRLEVLRRDQWTCQQTGVLLIGAYRTPNSPVVDHIRPHRGDPGLFWDPENLQAVSKAYHDGEKQRIEANADD